MTNDRTGLVGEITAALILMTRLPIRWRGAWPDSLSRRSMAWFPLVGAIVGAVGAIVLWGATVGLGLPMALAAVLAVAAQLIMTGAFHEDGLADTADGLGGGRDRDRKLAIMRDSRLGTYGVTALWVALTIRALALAHLPVGLAGVALILTGVCSRAGMVPVSAMLPPARAEGMAATVRQPGRREVLISLAGTVACALPIVMTIGTPALGMATATLIASAAGCIIVALLALRQLGGVTGDVLGACQQTAEVASLVAIVAILEVL